MSKLAVLADLPAEDDCLGFSRYVEPLFDILTNKETQSPFTVGIFGTWGSGKSTLLHLLGKRLEDAPKEKRGVRWFVCIKFNPWLYRGEPNMLLPLLHAVQQALEKNNRFKAKDTLNRFGKAILRFGADVLLKKATSGTLSLNQISEFQNKYMEGRKQVESEIHGLRSLLSELAGDVAKLKGRLVIFVDDLDRCDHLEIIELLEGIKLFFDVENTFIFLALDKEVIDHGIALRYERFEFEDDRKAKIGAEYLEKMIQLPLRILPLTDRQVADYVEHLKLPASVADQKDLLLNLLPPNPRKIKRILNTLAVTVALWEHAGIKEEEINKDLMVRLAVLQVRDEAIFKRILEEKKFLLGLEAIYRKPHDLQRPEAFAKFGSLKNDVLAFCKKHYQPNTYLKHFFAHSNFAHEENHLDMYLSAMKD